MKKLLSFLAMALLFVACQNDLGYNATENGLVTARFGVSAGELSTRADEATAGYSSALGAIDNFSEADWAKYNLRFIFEVYDKDDNGSGTPIAKERQVSVVDSYKEGDEVFFEVRLVPNKEYKFVVFADFVNDGTNAETVEDLYYNTEDLRNITMIDGKMNPMNEARDAYFVSKNLLVKTSIEEALRLSRPFGKIRVVTNDFEHIAKYAAPAKAVITYKNYPIYKSFNAVNGQVSVERAGDAELSFEYELGKDKLYTEGRDSKASEMTLFADYLLAFPEGQNEINFLLSVYDANGNDIKSNDFTGQIPIERNHLTTIEGSLLTNNTKVNIVIDDQFDDEYVIDNIWNGEYKELPEANEEGVVEITEAGELATLFTEGSDENISVELTEDFNFDGYVIEPVADMKKFKNIELNGNNKTISNLVINAAETRANGGIAALFPAVIGAKIENLTISNITVDAGEGENAYAAALIGKSYGTVVLNNVVVENSTIKGTNKVGGLVASVMENKIIATNCGVNNVTIETYDVEKESGLAGGLIGYIACAGDGSKDESCIEECFVTNSTFNVINSRGNNERANSEFIGGIGGDKGDVLLINNATIEDNEFNETGAEEYTSPYGKFIGGLRGNFKVYIDNVMVGKLDKPVVSAAVEGNVVTLTWEAIDGAEAYSITNGVEMPVVVEATEYAFTGEYETTYTFYVVALPKNEEINTPSDAAEVSATTEEEPARKVTVAEFLAAAEDSTMYELTGVITSVTQTTYGNFYLKDSTGEVLIYGLCSPTGEQKYWAASGAKVGDTITVQTVRTSYNGAPQGKNALFVELTPFVAQATEWGVVGDFTNWGGTTDVVMYNTWHTENLFVAYNVEIGSGSFKIRANNAWNDAKNYGLETAGSIYNNKYYSVITGGGSQNITPMEYGKYDIYFDLTNKRVALMTPGKAYSEAENGGNPIVVIAGLKEHEWGVVGSFNGWDVANYVVAEVDGDWAVAKGVTLEKNAEFKFAADKAWTLSYGTGGNVNVGQTYTTYNNGGNMKYVGEAGNFDIYFSLVDASFYMEQHVDKQEYVSTLTFDDKAKRTTFTSTQQIWVENGVTLINDKAASTNNVADYAKPARFYQGSKITVDADGGEISKIVFDCNSSSYATDLKNSIGTTATVSVSSDKVTVTLDGATEFVIAKLTKQVRMDSVTVTYEK